MYSHTLNNWDGSQSQRQLSVVETQKPDEKRSNIVSQQRDGPVYPNAPNTRASSNGVVQGDATNSPNALGNPSRRSIDGVNSKRPNSAPGHKTQCDNSLQEGQEGNQTASTIAALYNGLATTSRSTPIRSHLPQANSRVGPPKQNSSRLHLDTPKSISGDPSRINVSTPSSETISVIPRQIATSSTKSKAQYHTKRPEHAQVLIWINPQSLLNRSMERQEPCQDQLTRPSLHPYAWLYCLLFDLLTDGWKNGKNTTPRLNGNPPGSLTPIQSSRQPSVNSTQVQRTQATPNIVIPHPQNFRAIAPKPSIQQQSSPSTSSTLTSQYVETSRISPSPNPPSTQTPSPTTRHENANRLLHHSYPPKFPSSNLPASSSLLVASSHPSDSLASALSDPLTDYTSADADGSSVDEHDIEILETPPSMRRSQFIAPISPSNQPSTTQHTNNDKSVYDLFTPPPTSPPPQLREIAKRRPASHTRKRQMAYVLVPPLPPKYRALFSSDPGPKPRAQKRRKVQEEGADSEVDRLDKWRRERERRKQREQAEERRRSMMAQSQPQPVASTSKAILPFPSSSTEHRAYELQKRQQKAVISGISMRKLKPKPKPKPETETVLGKEVPRPVDTPNPTSTHPATSASTSYKRVKSSGPSTASTSKTPRASESESDDNNDSQLLIESSEDYGARELKFRCAVHSSVTAIYSNTRFAQKGVLDREFTEWMRLGMKVKRNCFKPEYFFRDLEEIGVVEDTDREEMESGWSVGGPLIWNCPSDEDKSVSQSTARAQKQKKPKKKLLGRFLPAFAPPLPFYFVPPHPVSSPQADRPRIFLSPKAVGLNELRQRREEEVSKTQVDGLSQSPDSETIDTSMPVLEGKERARRSPTLAPQTEAPPYLSEKARGKQKAVDPQPLDISFPQPHIPTSPTNHHHHTSNPTTSQVQLQPVNLHDTFESNMDNYVDFGFSPEKSSDQVNAGDNNSTSSSSKPLPITQPGFGTYSPSIILETANDAFRPEATMGNVLIGSHTFDSHNFGSTVSSTSTFDPRSAYYPFKPPFGTNFVDGEKDDQPTTIDPSFLTRDERQDDEIAPDSELNEGAREEMEGEEESGLNKVSEGLEIAVSEEDAILMDEGEDDQPIINATIAVSSNASTSSQLAVSPPPTTQAPRTPPQTIPSPPRVNARSLSPEFPEYEAGGPSSQVHVSQVQPSRASSHSSSSVYLPARPARSRTRALVIDDDDEDDNEDEREVQQGLVDYVTSSDDNFVGSTGSAGPPVSRRPRRATKATWKKRATMKVGPTTAAPPSTSVSSLPKPKTKKQTAPRRAKEQWPCGEEEAYCHQCRRKTRYLKMSCPCAKKYCNRCMFLRYPQREFVLKLDDSDCPACHDECNCDICTRKRGEEYVSLTVSIAQAGNSLPVLFGGSDEVEEARTPTPDHVVDLSPLPSDVEDIAGPLTFWGTIYDFNGEKYADGFAGPGAKAIVAKVIEGYTGDIQGQAGPNNVEHVDEDEVPISRVFIGTCQPSWRLGKSPIIKEIGKRGKNKGRRIPDEEEFQDSGDTSRWFVGKERMLYLPVVAYAEDLSTPNPFSDLSSLSSLSSLSDESDVEVHAEPTIRTASSSSDPTSYHINDTINATNSIVDVSFDPNAIEAEDTIRALAKALEALGMIVKIGKQVSESMIAGYT
ncbi:hypothetical protein NP233_g1665 [Leucocoprinus birnbaumii]|uniref:Zinc-finger domain-containing protein n=1 Tax=Leucocoprinus birnbaumii TaxID=56174 RepID=A0AAD5W257_9AGAR|nr:hypothetical protein NP233_g1665 [Leucocoprinus birnbaumii]